MSTAEPVGSRLLTYDEFLDLATETLSSKEKDNPYFTELKDAYKHFDTITDAGSTEAYLSVMSLQVLTLRYFSYNDLAEEFTEQLLPGMEDYLGSHLEQVPRRLHFVLLEQADDVRLEYIETWVSVYQDFDIHLWFDRQALLSDLLYQQVFEQYSPSSSGQPDDFNDELARTIIRIQDSAGVQIRRDMSRGASFDDAAQQFLSHQFNLSEQYISEHLDRRLQWRRELVSRLSNQRTGVDGAGRIYEQDAYRLWEKGNELAPFYQRELLHGNTEGADNLLRIEILRQHGGAVVSSSILPALHPELILELEKFTDVPGELLQAASLQAYMDQGGYPNRARKLRKPDRGGYLDYLAELDQQHPGLAQQLRDMIADRESIFAEAKTLDVIPGTLVAQAPKGRIGDDFVASVANASFVDLAFQTVKQRYQLIAESGAESVESRADVLDSQSDLFNIMKGQEASLTQAWLGHYRLASLSGNDLMNTLLSGGDVWRHAVRSGIQAIETVAFVPEDHPLGSQVVPACFMTEEAYALPYDERRQVVAQAYQQQDSSVLQTVVRLSSTPIDNYISQFLHRAGHISTLAEWPLNEAEASQLGQDVQVRVVFVGHLQQSGDDQLTLSGHSVPEFVESLLSDRSLMSRAELHFVIHDANHNPERVQSWLNTMLVELDREGLTIENLHCALSLTRVDLLGRSWYFAGLNGEKPVWQQGTGENWLLSRQPDRSWLVTRHSLMADQVSQDLRTSMVDRISDRALSLYHQMIKRQGYTTRDEQFYQTRFEVEGFQIELVLDSMVADLSDETTDYFAPADLYRIRSDTEKAFTRLASANLYPKDKTHHFQLLFSLREGLGEDVFFTGDKTTLLISRNFFRSDKDIASIQTIADRSQVEHGVINLLQKLAMVVYEGLAPTDFWQQYNAHHNEQIGCTPGSLHQEDLHISAAPDLLYDDLVSSQAGVSRLDFISESLAARLNGETLPLASSRALHELLLDNPEPERQAFSMQQQAIYFAWRERLHLLRDGLKYNQELAWVRNSLAHLSDHLSDSQTLLLVRPGSPLTQHDASDTYTQHLSSESLQATLDAKEKAYQLTTNPVFTLIQDFDSGEVLSFKRHSSIAEYLSLGRFRRQADPLEAEDIIVPQGLEQQALMLTRGDDVIRDSGLPERLLDQWQQIARNHRALIVITPPSGSGETGSGETGSGDLAGGAEDTTAATQNETGQKDSNGFLLLGLFMHLDALPEQQYWEVARQADPLDSRLMDVDGTFTGSMRLLHSRWQAAYERVRMDLHSSRHNQFERHRRLVHLRQTVLEELRSATEGFTGLREYQVLDSVGQQADPARQEQALFITADGDLYQTRNRTQFQSLMHYYRASHHYLGYLNQPYRTLVEQNQRYPVLDDIIGSGTQVVFHHSIDTSTLKDFVSKTLLLPDIEPLPAVPPLIHLNDELSFKAFGEGYHAWRVGERTRIELYPEGDRSAPLKVMFLEADSRDYLDAHDQDPDFLPERLQYDIDFAVTRCLSGPLVRELYLFTEASDDHSSRQVQSIRLILEPTRTFLNSVNRLDSHGQSRILLGMADISRHPLEGVEHGLSRLVASGYLHAAIHKRFRNNSKALGSIRHVWGLQPPALEKLGSLIGLTEAYRLVSRTDNQDPLYSELTRGQRHDLKILAATNRFQVAIERLFRLNRLSHALGNVGQFLRQNPSLDGSALYQGLMDVHNRFVHNRFEDGLERRAFRHAIGEDNLRWLVSQFPEHEALANLWDLRQQDDRGLIPGISDTVTTDSSASGLLYQVAGVNDSIGILLTPEYRTTAKSGQIERDLQRIHDLLMLFLQQTSLSEVFTDTLARTVQPDRPLKIGGLKERKLIRTRSSVADRLSLPDSMTVLIVATDQPDPINRNNPSLNRALAYTPSEQEGRGSFALIYINPCSDQPLTDAWLSKQTDFMAELIKAATIVVGELADDRYDRETVEAQIRSDLNLPERLYQPLRAADLVVQEPAAQVTPGNVLTDYQVALPETPFTRSQIDEQVLASSYGHDPESSTPYLSLRLHSNGQEGRLVLLSGFGLIHSYLEKADTPVSFYQLQHWLEDSLKALGQKFSIADLVTHFNDRLTGSLDSDSPYRLKVIMSSAIHQISDGMTLVPDVELYIDYRVFSQLFSGFDQVLSLNNWKNRAFQLSQLEAANLTQSLLTPPEQQVTRVLGQSSDDVPKALGDQTGIPEPVVIPPGHLPSFFTQLLYELYLGATYTHAMPEQDHLSPFRCTPTDAVISILSDEEILFFNYYITAHGHQRLLDQLQEALQRINRFALGERSANTDVLQAMDLSRLARDVRHLFVDVLNHRLVRYQDGVVEVVPAFALGAESSNGFSPVRPGSVELVEHWGSAVTRRLPVVTDPAETTRYLAVSAETADSILARLPEQPVSAEFASQLTLLQQLHAPETLDSELIPVLTHTIQNVLDQYPDAVQPLIHQQLNELLGQLSLESSLQMAETLVRGRLSATFGEKLSETIRLSELADALLENQLLKAIVLDIQESAQNTDLASGSSSGTNDVSGSGSGENDRDSLEIDGLEVRVLVAGLATLTEQRAFYIDLDGLGDGDDRVRVELIDDLDIHDSQRPQGLSERYQIGVQEPLWLDNSFINPDYQAQLSFLSQHSLQTEVNRLVQLFNRRNDFVDRLEALHEIIGEQSLPSLTMQLDDGLKLTQSSLRVVTDAKGEPGVSINIGLQGLTFGSQPVELARVFTQLYGYGLVIALHKDDQRTLRQQVMALWNLREVPEISRMALDSDLNLLKLPDDADPLFQVFITRASEDYRFSIGAESDFIEVFEFYQTVDDGRLGQAIQDVLLYSREHREHSVVTFANGLSHFEQSRRDWKAGRPVRAALRDEDYLYLQQQLEYRPEVDNDSWLFDVQSGSGSGSASGAETSTPVSGSGSGSGVTEHPYPELYGRLERMRLQAGADRKAIRGNDGIVEVFFSDDRLFTTLDPSEVYESPDLPNLKVIIEEGSNRLRHYVYTPKTDQKTALELITLKSAPGRQVLAVQNYTTGYRYKVQPVTDDDNLYQVIHELINSSITASRLLRQANAVSYQLYQAGSLLYVSQVGLDESGERGIPVRRIGALSELADFSREDTPDGYFQLAGSDSSDGSQYGVIRASDSTEQLLSEPVLELLVNEQHVYHRVNPELTTEILYPLNIHTPDAAELTAYSRDSLASSQWIAKNSLADDEQIYSLGLMHQEGLSIGRNDRVTDVDSVLRGIYQQFNDLLASVDSSASGSSRVRRDGTSVQDGQLFLITPSTYGSDSKVSHLAVFMTGEYLSAVNGDYGTSLAAIGKSLEKFIKSSEGQTYRSTLESGKGSGGISLSEMADAGFIRTQGQIPERIVTPEGVQQLFILEPDKNLASPIQYRPSGQAAEVTVLSFDARKYINQNYAQASSDRTELMARLDETVAQQRQEADTFDAVKSENQIRKQLDFTPIENLADRRSVKQGTKAGRYGFEVELRWVETEAPQREHLAYTPQYGANQYPALSVTVDGLDGKHIIELVGAPFSTDEYNQSQDIYRAKQLITDTMRELNQKRTNGSYTVEELVIEYNKKLGSYDADFSKKFKLSVVDAHRNDKIYQGRQTTHGPQVTISLDYESLGNPLSGFESLYIGRKQHRQVQLAQVYAASLAGQITPTPSPKLKSLMTQLMLKVFQDSGSENFSKEKYFEPLIRHGTADAIAGIIDDSDVVALKQFIDGVGGIEGFKRFMKRPLARLYSDEGFAQIPENHERLFNRRIESLFGDLLDYRHTNGRTRLPDRIFSDFFTLPDHAGRQRKTYHIDATNSPSRVPVEEVEGRYKIAVEIRRPSHHLIDLDSKSPDQLGETGRLRLLQQPELLGKDRVANEGALERVIELKRSTRDPRIKRWIDLEIRKFYGSLPEAERVSFEQTLLDYRSVFSDALVKKGAVVTEALKPVAQAFFESRITKLVASLQSGESITPSDIEALGRYRTLVLGTPYEVNFGGKRLSVSFAPELAHTESTFSVVDGEYRIRLGGSPAPVDSPELDVNSSGQGYKRSTNSTNRLIVDSDNHAARRILNSYDQSSFYLTGKGGEESYFPRTVVVVDKKRYRTLWRNNQLRPSQAQSDVEAIARLFLDSEVGGFRRAAQALAARAEVDLSKGRSIEFVLRPDLEFKNTTMDLGSGDYDGSRPIRIEVGVSDFPTVTQASAHHALNQMYGIALANSYDPADSGLGPARGVVQSVWGVDHASQSRLGQRIGVSTAGNLVSLPDTNTLFHYMVADTAHDLTYLRGSQEDMVTAITWLSQQDPVVLDTAIERAFEYINTPVKQNSDADVFARSLVAAQKQLPKDSASRLRLTVGENNFKRLKNLVSDDSQLKSQLARDAVLAKRDKLKASTTESDGLGDVLASNGRQPGTHTQYDSPEAPPGAFQSRSRSGDTTTGPSRYSILSNSLEARANVVADTYRWMTQGSVSASENYIPVPGFQRSDVEVPGPTRLAMKRAALAFLQDNANRLPRTEYGRFAELFVDATLEHDWDLRVRVLTELESHGYNFNSGENSDKIVSFWTGGNTHPYEVVLNESAKGSGKRVVFDTDFNGFDFAHKMNRAVGAATGGLLDTNFDQFESARLSLASNAGFWSSVYTAGAQNNVLAVSEGGLVIGKYFWNVELPVLRELQRQGIVNEIRILDQPAEAYRGVSLDHIGHRVSDPGFRVQVRFDALSEARKRVLLSENPDAYKPGTKVPIQINTSAIDTLVSKRLPLYRLRLERNLHVTPIEGGFEVSVWADRLGARKQITIDGANPEKNIKTAERFILANYESFQELPTRLHVTDSQIISFERGRNRQIKTKVLATKRDGLWDYKQSEISTQQLILDSRKNRFTETSRAGFEDSIFGITLAPDGNRQISIAVGGGGRCSRAAGGLCSGRFVIVENPDERILKSVQNDEISLSSSRSADSGRPFRAVDFIEFEGRIYLLVQETDTELRVRQLADDTSIVRALANDGVTDTVETLPPDARSGLRRIVIEQSTGDIFQLVPDPDSTGSNDAVRLTETDRLLPVYEGQAETVARVQQRVVNGDVEYGIEIPGSSRVILLDPANSLPDTLSAYNAATRLNRGQVSYQVLANSKETIGIVLGPDFQQGGRYHAAAEAYISELNRFLYANGSGQQLLEDLGSHSLQRPPSLDQLHPSLTSTTEVPDKLKLMLVLDSPEAFADVRRHRIQPLDITAAQPGSDGQPGSGSRVRIHVDPTFGLGSSVPDTANFNSRLTAHLVDLYQASAQVQGIDTPEGFSTIARKTVRAAGLPVPDGASITPAGLENILRRQYQLPSVAGGNNERLPVATQSGSTRIGFRQQYHGLTVHPGANQLSADFYNRLLVASSGDTSDGRPILSLSGEEGGGGTLRLSVVSGLDTQDPAIVTARQQLNAVLAESGGSGLSLNEVVSRYNQRLNRVFGDGVYPELRLSRFNDDLPSVRSLHLNSEESLLRSVQTRLSFEYAAFGDPLSGIQNLVFTQRNENLAYFQEAQFQASLLADSVVSSTGTPEARRHLAALFTQYLYQRARQVLAEIPLNRDTLAVPNEEFYPRSGTVDAITAGATEPVQALRDYVDAVGVPNLTRQLYEASQAVLGQGLTSDELGDSGRLGALRQQVELSARRVFVEGLNTRFDEEGGILPPFVLPEAEDGLDRVPLTPDSRVVLDVDAMDVHARSPMELHQNRLQAVAEVRSGSNAIAGLFDTPLADSSLKGRVNLLQSGSSIDYDANAARAFLNELVNDGPGSGATRAQWLSQQLEQRIQGLTDSGVRFVEDQYLQLHEPSGRPRPLTTAETEFGRLLAVRHLEQVARQIANGETADTDSLLRLNRLRRVTGIDVLTGQVDGESVSAAYTRNIGSNQAQEIQVGGSGEQRFIWLGSRNDLDFNPQGAGYKTEDVNDQGRYTLILTGNEIDSQLPNTRLIVETGDYQAAQQGGYLKNRQIQSDVNNFARQVLDEEISLRSRRFRQLAAADDINGGRRIEIRLRPDLELSESRLRIPDADSNDAIRLSIGMRGDTSSAAFRKGVSRLYGLALAGNYQGEGREALRQKVLSAWQLDSAEVQRLGSQVGFDQQLNLTRLSGQPDTLYQALAAEAGHNLQILEGSPADYQTVLRTLTQQGGLEAALDRVFTLIDTAPGDQVQGFGRTLSAVYDGFNHPLVGNRALAERLSQALTIQRQRTLQARGALAGTLPPVNEQPLPGVLDRQEALAGFYNDSFDSQISRSGVTGRLSFDEPIGRLQLLLNNLPAAEGYTGKENIAVTSETSFGEPALKLTFDPKEGLRLVSAPQETDRFNKNSEYHQARRIFLEMMRSDTTASLQERLQNYNKRILNSNLGSEWMLVQLHPDLAGLNLVENDSLGTYPARADINIEYSAFGDPLSGVDQLLNSRLLQSAQLEANYLLDRVSGQDQPSPRLRSLVTQFLYEQMETYLSHGRRPARWLAGTTDVVTGVLSESDIGHLASYQGLAQEMEQAMVRMAGRMEVSDFDLARVRLGGFLHDYDSTFRQAVTLRQQHGEAFQLPVDENRVLHFADGHSEVQALPGRRDLLDPVSTGERQRILWAPGDDRVMVGLSLEGDGNVLKPLASGYQAELLGRVRLLQGGGLGSSETARAYFALLDRLYTDFEAETQSIIKRRVLANIDQVSSDNVFLRNHLASELVEYARNNPPPDFESGFPVHRSRALLAKQLLLHELSSFATQAQNGDTPGEVAYKRLNGLLQLAGDGEFTFLVRRNGRTIPHTLVTDSSLGADASYFYRAGRRVVVGTGDPGRLTGAVALVLMQEAGRRDSRLSSEPVVSIYDRQPALPAAEAEKISVYRLKQRYRLKAGRLSVTGTLDRLKQFAELAVRLEAAGQAELAGRIRQEVANNLEVIREFDLSALSYEGRDEQGRTTRRSFLDLSSSELASSLSEFDHYELPRARAIHGDYQGEPVSRAISDLDGISGRLDALQASEAYERVRGSVTKKSDLNLFETFDRVHYSRPPSVEAINFLALAESQQLVRQAMTDLLNSPERNLSPVQVANEVTKALVAAGYEGDAELLKVQLSSNERFVKQLDSLSDIGSLPSHRVKPPAGSVIGKFQRSRLALRLRSIAQSGFWRKVEAVQASKGFQKAQLAVGGIQAIVGLVKTTQALENLSKYRDYLTDDALKAGYIGVGFGYTGSIFGITMTVNRVLGSAIGSTSELGALGSLTRASSKVAKNTSRFFSVVGSLIAVAAGVFAMYSSAKAADAARKAGNTAQAIYYGVDAALSGIGVVIDTLSLMFDFVFPPLAFLLDLVGSAIGIIQAILADFVPPPNARQQFDSLIGNEGFDEHVDQIAAQFLDSFHRFIYRFDASEFLDRFEFQGEDFLTLQSQVERLSQVLSNGGVSVIDHTVSFQLYQGTIFP